MITDIHAHYHPDRYVEALRRVRPGAQGAMAPHPDTGSEEHIQARLRLMEEAGDRTLAELVKFLHEPR